MKMSYVKLNVKTLFLSAVSALVFMSNYAHATTVSTTDYKTGDKKSAKNMQVISLGNTTTGNLLEVNYTNAEAGEFSFFITNADEDILFENNYSGKEFAKKVLIPNELVGQKIYINIKDYKTGTTYTSEVEILTKSINQVNINIK